MVFLLLSAIAVRAELETLPIWLTHRTNDPSRLCVNWQTDAPAKSAVHYGDTPELGQSAPSPGESTLHHVEIPFGEGESPLYYAIEVAGQRSAVHKVQRYGGTEFRAAVVADWQGRPDLAALMKDAPHLLLIAGDQIYSLHQDCGAGVKDCVKPFAKLVTQYAALFRTVPVMPALGNHDREIRPRGPKPPAEAAYDVEATAWRAFYPLPDDGWKWRFDIPGFDLRFLALDLQHTQDMGTTWQTGHPFDANSEQFKWYREQIGRRDRAFVITLHNERNAAMRNYEKQEWHRLFRQGSAAISGFGYYAERAELDGALYFNTALGTGAKYPDPQSKFLAGEASYILLRFPRERGRFAVEIKSLAGAVLDRSEHGAKAR
jgi:hypothetical protein